MLAVLYDRYGPADVLRLGEVPVPAVLAGEVRVRVTRAALNPKDSFFRKGRFRLLSGRRFPKLCGLDLAGVVLESRSPHFAPGQRVLGCLDEWRFQRGTLAEQVTCREAELAPLPDAVSDEAGAAMALVGLTALQALRDVAQARPGQRLLINGASGGVGTVAIQLGRNLGLDVHTVSSAANLALCRELGAHHAWTYPEHGWKSDSAFDVIFDVFGNLSYSGVRRHLTARGCFVSTVPSAARLLRERLSRLLPQRQRLVVVRPDRADLSQLGAWLAEGRLRAVIDGRYPLAQVRAAFARLESKRTRGKIVIEVDPSGAP